MKVVLVIAVALALLGPVLAWVFIDGPTAVFFAAGTGVVLFCAAMPVLFGVVTRRQRASSRYRREAEVIPTIDRDAAARRSPDR